MELDYVVIKLIYYEVQVQNSYVNLTQIQVWIH